MLEALHSNYPVRNSILAPVELNTSLNAAPLSKHEILNNHITAPFIIKILTCLVPLAAAMSAGYGVGARAMHS